ncbi:4-hydroxy-tetrahydrodipicolinate synthase [Synergistes jonesii]|uniref:4-hydroxy-tetrahydrodipicolinate synthase n=1 Tax=Synergistes jonesii TaxID=2754 RepID=A0A073IVK7_9BACT|nr:4-hydroxy-tetrahydrodipicolinate synthase [Synergistes jonesii]KEJ93486.1 hypothetical protein EH55_01545 [Synergistes jonesii]MDY2985137.1 4-hydroxy-tetrahydrodipicolinate synthase [Synergistes jonesii]OFB61449.1 hypothetical protein JS72_10905 [Synergistes jonesii]OFB65273.1 hypothetical protein JS73_00200 [Synergistes jonesii]OFB68623.1 hypothetical protein JS79_00210 [Synergistes jonesii]
MKLKGIITALVTPLLDGEAKLNKPVLQEITEYAISNGVHGVCVLGGTGEYCALTDEVKTSAIETVVEKVNGRVPVVVGIVEPGIGQTIKMVRKAKEIGADVAMVVSPYYVSVSQEGLIDYYSKISDTADIPLVLYNVPYRTGTNIEPQTVSTIADQCNVIGIKECSPNMAQVQKLISLCGDKISLLSGEDLFVVLEMTFGIEGGILASASIIPDKWVEIYDAMKKGDIKGAIERHTKLLPFFSAMFSECNPGPLKASMELKGFNVGPVVSPLTQIKEENLAKLKAVMKDMRMI